MSDDIDIEDKYMIYCSIDTLYQTILAMKTQLGPEKNMNSGIGIGMGMGMRVRKGNKGSIGVNKDKKANSDDNEHDKEKDIIKRDIRLIKEDSDIEFSKSIIQQDYSDHSNSSYAVSARGNNANHNVNVINNNPPSNILKSSPRHRVKRNKAPTSTPIQSPNRSPSPSPSANREEDRLNKNSSNANSKPNKSNKTIDKDIYTFKYFIQLKVLLFLSATITNCYIFIFLLCLSPSKNNTYCFDQVYKEFIKCPPTELFNCAKGRNEHIYTNLIYNDDQLTELITVNELYLSFYHRDFSNFIYFNTHINPSDQTTLSYSVRIALTKNERYLLKNIFRYKCNNENMAMLVTFIIGLLTGNIAFGYLADVFGRKSILIITLVIQGIGGFIVVIVVYATISKGTVNVSGTDGFDYINYSKIKDYIESTAFTNTIGLTKTGLYREYTDNFNQIKTETLESQLINKAFKDHHFLLLFGLIVLSLGNSSNYSIIRAYLLEYSLCEDFFFSDCVQIHLTEPLGLVLSYLMILFIDSFEITLIIVNTLSIVLAIAIYFLLYESLRFYFEYSRFDLITDAVRRILSNHSNFFNPIGGKRLSFILDIKKENNEEYKTMVDNAKVSFWRSFIMARSINTVPIQHMKNSNKLLLRKEYFYAYPRLILALLRFNPSIQNEFLTTLSFITVTGCVHYISISKASSSLMLSRHTIHHNIFFNMLPLYIGVIYALSLSGFSMILKVLNMHYVFLISFIGAILFSFAFELVSLFPGTINDLNVNYYASHEVLYEEHKTTLVALYFCQLFFVLSVKFACFYYMTKLTKTVYRCTFYGLWNCLFYLALLLAYLMGSLFNNTLFYVVLFCILGLFALYFISKNTGVGITSDLHEIKKKKKNKLN